MKITASSVHKYLNCPASCALEDSLSRADEDKAYEGAATFGRMIHKAGELSIQIKGAKSPVAALKAAGITKEHARYIDALYIVKEYKRRITAIKKRAEKLATGRIKYYIEEKFRINVEGVDCVFKADFLAHIITPSGPVIFTADLKTGNRDYTESAGDQMEFSAQVFCENLKTTKPVKVFAYVIQPLFYDEAKQIIELIFDYAGPDFALTELKENILYIKHNADRFTPCKSCLTCSGVASCPAQKSHALFLESVMESFSQDEAGVSDELLEYIWNRKAGFEAFLKAVAQRIENGIQHGKQYESIFLKETYDQRKWNDVKEVKKALKHLGDKIYKAPEILSPAQMEKLAGAKNIEGLYTKPTRYTLTEVDRTQNESPFEEVD